MGNGARPLGGLGPVEQNGRDHDRDRRRYRGPAQRREAEGGEVEPAALRLYRRPRRTLGRRQQSHHFTALRAGGQMR